MDLKSNLEDELVQIDLISYIETSSKVTGVESNVENETVLIV